MVNPEQAVIQVNKILGLFREQNWPIYHVLYLLYQTLLVLIFIRIAVLRTEKKS
jgi:hypothetical protein